MIIAAFIIIHWYLSLFCQTFFQHRYAAHRMFEMSRRWEKVFFIFSFFVQGSSYLSPYAYAILHRMHHAHTDTENDPHSPSYQSNIFAMMMRTIRIYAAIFKRQADVEKRFLKGIPRWDSFEKLAHNRVAKFFWMSAYTSFYIVFATEWWMYLFLPLHFMMGAVHGVIINWFAHKYGYRNYDELEDTSKNLFPIDILMLGEGFHNNHHKHSSSPNFGVKWFEFDPVYPIIRLFSILGIIQMKKAPA